MKALIKRLLCLIPYFNRKTTRYNKVVCLTKQPDSRISYGTLYVVMAGEFPKWLLFKCPCGCGETLQLPLISNHYPHWKIINQEGAITVSPSINITDKCRSHFWIRENKVVWAE